jgi:hypothetical protein
MEDELHYRLLKTVRGYGLERLAANRQTEATPETGLRTAGTPIRFFSD